MLWKKINNMGEFLVCYDEIDNTVDSYKFGKLIFPIHDNGGRPFVVVINPTIQIFTISENLNNGEMDSSSINENDDCDVFRPIPELTNIHYDQVWIGQTPEYEALSGQEFGCNILFRVKQTLVNVGAAIESFPLESGDQVKWYSVPFGGNDVPMPYVVTKRWTYLIAEHVRVLTQERKRKDPKVEDPYWNEYYHWEEKKDAVRLAKYHRFYTTTIKPRL